MINAYLSYRDLKIKNHLAVLPCGDMTDNILMNWGADQLKPYLTNILSEQTKDTMFGGLIFNPISTRKNHYIYPLYAGFGEIANKVDWQIFTENMFTKEINLWAVAQLAKETIDIWITLPYPLSFQHNFGEINGKNLDFLLAEDRLAALMWWINNFIIRWEKEAMFLTNLKFRGFVWQREIIGEQDSALVKLVNGEIRRRQLLSLWLANYGSQGVIDWRELGFDATCINPNFYGNTNHDYKWINNGAAFAKVYKTGIQINCGKGLIFNDTHLLDYLNLGLSEYNNYIQKCLLVYRFTNQNLAEVCRDSNKNYLRIYRFIKGKYKKVRYKGMPY